MRQLIRSALLAVFLACLASCGGNDQAAPQQGVGGSRAMAVSPGVAAEYEDLVQQLYVGYFGRPADPAGLANYTQALRSANAPTTVRGLFDAYGTNAGIRGLLDSFSASDESRQLYPACAWVGCDYQWISALYHGLFSREPDSEGAQFWANALNAKGATRAVVLLSVLAGAQGPDAELLARKTRVAAQFTRALNTGGKGSAYSGQLAAAVARAMLQNVPGLADDVAAQANVDATIQRLADMVSGTVEEVAPGSRKVLLLASAERFADNAGRLFALADAMAKDLNQLRQNAPAWSVSVARAADSISAVRGQLRGYDGVILVGQIPIPAGAGVPFLDVYRLPDCPAFEIDGTGVVQNALALHSPDPRCQNGLIVSVLRGTTVQAEAVEVANKLDQMIAYHRASNTANAAWIQRFRVVEAGWFGGPEKQWGDLSSKWSGMTLFAANAISYLNEGTAIQRRDQFLDCISQDAEVCAVNVHGSHELLQFEGLGTPGVFYAKDSTDWYATQIAPGSVRAKYIDLTSCSTQDFLHEHSMGTSLLMRGRALLTRGMTAETFVASTYPEDVIRNEYALLQNGSTFAEALYGRMENSPESIQGDPYITMRPAPVGAQPRLVIDGKHYNNGAMSLPLAMPDAVGGASSIRVVSFSNRGDADLHVRIGSMFAVTGVDDGSGHVAWEFGTNAQYGTDLRQIFSDGRVLAQPFFDIEPNGGAMPVTLKPGESVAIAYQLNVRTGSDGKPKRTGLYTGQLTVTSDDPASARIYLAMQGRVR